MKKKKIKNEDRFKIIKIEPLGMDIFFYHGKVFGNIDSHLSRSNKKWLNKKLGYDIEGFYEEAKTTTGLVLSNEDSRPVVVYVQEKNLYTVIHEVHHIVERLASYFCFTEEVEFKAYLQESLTRIIWDLVKSK